MEKFFETLSNYLASIPYNIQIPLEKYYQSIFYVILSLLGAKVDIEELTNNGRIDAVLETASTIYLFEFKLYNTAQEALNQIEDKKYYQKYLNQKKPIQLVGVQFDTEEKNIKNWLSSIKKPG